MDWSDPDNLQRCARGEIPWDPEKMSDLIQFVQQLHETPKDDWDLPKVTPLPKPAAPDGITIRMNMLHPMNQIGFHCLDLNKECSDEEKMAHMFRAMEALQFLEEQRDRLMMDGLGMFEEGSGDPMISSAVVHALAVLPMSDRTVSEKGGGRWQFNYEEVLAKARELDEEEAED